MPKIKYENGVRIKIYEGSHPMIFIGEGPHVFKIESETETKIYMFETEEGLNEFKQHMSKIHPNKNIEEKNI